MDDYCPNCGSDDIEGFMNGEDVCVECGHVWEDGEE